MLELVIHVLEGFRVTTRDGASVRIASRKAQGVLAALALRPGHAYSRDQLAALLWDDSPADLARASLRQALAALRRHLPEPALDAIVCTADTVMLDPARGTSDLQQFRDGVRSGRTHELIGATERHGGQLLPGFGARSSAFDAWLDEHRREHVREWSSAMERAVAQCVAAEDAEGAVRALVRLLGVEPANEAAHRQLIDLYARLGDHTAALRQYRTCVEALRHYLDVAPEPATEALYRDVMRRRRAAGAETAATPGPSGEPAPAPAPAGVLDTLRETVVLVACVGPGRGRDHDPERLRNEWQRAEAEVAAIVRRHGGEPGRLVQGELVAAFGLESNTGNELARALRAALSIVAVGGPAATAPAVGIAAGLVLPDRTDAGVALTGGAVHTAQALARAAPAGEVRLNASLAAQAGERYRLQPVGDDACTVTGTDVVLAGAALAGRKLELAMLTTLLDQVATSRRGRVVLVRGEPGIGKSSLLAAFQAAARERATVHVAQVLDFGQPADERPWPTLARALLGIEDGADSEAVRAALANSVLTGLVLPEERAAAEDLLALDRGGAAAGGAGDRTARERQQLRVMFRLAERASEARPVLLVVEDVHWADPDELARLGDLAGRAAQWPVLLALTSRAEGDPLTASWRERARGAPVTTLDLAPLAPDEALEITASYPDVPPELIQRCLETAGGNPLFLVQLLRAARAGQVELPASVRATLLARVERLPPADQRVLHAAAVLGPRFALDALRHVAGHPLLEARALEGTGLLDCDGEHCGFSHALVRDAVYESLLRSTRRMLHERAAAWFAGRDVALHAEHLDAADDPGAALAHLRAAEADQRASRHDRAFAHAERARRLAAVPGERLEATLKVGELQLARGRTTQAADAYRRAAELAAGPEARVRARLGLATSLRILDRYDEALGVVAEAERDAAATGEPRALARVWTLRGNLHFPRGEFDDCLQAHERALEFARQAGAQEEVAAALGGLGDAQYQRGRMLSALGHVERCIDLAREHGWSALERAYLPMAGIMRAYCGEFGTALELVVRATRAAQAAGDLRTELLSHSLRAQIEFYRARPDVAVEASRRSAALARETGAHRFEAESLVLQGLSLRALDRRDEAAATLDDAIELARAGAQGYCGAWACAALAWAGAEAGRGYALLEEGERLLARGCVSHNHLEYRWLAIEFLLEQRDWAGALRQADALERYVAAEPLAWAGPVVARARALAAHAARPRPHGCRAALTQALADAERLEFHALSPRLRAALATRRSGAPA